MSYFLLILNLCWPIIIIFTRRIGMLLKSNDIYTNKIVIHSRIIRLAWYQLNCNLHKYCSKQVLIPICIWYYLVCSRAKLIVSISICYNSTQKVMDCKFHNPSAEDNHRFMALSVSIDSTYRQPFYRSTVELMGCILYRL